MPHFVYIIQSQVDGSYYVGETHDIPLRIQRHNDGWSRSTKLKRPWTLVYQEIYPSRSDALRREKEIKKMKSSSYIRRLISGAGGRPDGHSPSGR
jgi:putative endonuclease